MSPHLVLSKGRDWLWRLAHTLGWDTLARARVRVRDDLEEIGTAYGGWVVPANVLRPGAICYCFGCGEDISFDLGLIEKFDCEVFGFDPTPRAIQHVQDVAGDNPRYHFHEVGVWDSHDSLRFYVPRNSQHVSHSLVNLQQTDDHIVVEVKPVRQLMNELFHDRIDVLKIDIEGAEYRVIESILADQLDVKVICVEYDEHANPLDAEFRKRIRASIRLLEASGYSLVSAQSPGNYTLMREA